MRQLNFFQKFVACQEQLIAIKNYIAFAKSLGKTKYDDLPIEEKNLRNKDKREVQNER